MTLAQRKLNIINQIIHINDKKLIKEIEIILAAKYDFWNELSKEEKDGIDRGLTELNEGKRIPLSEVKKMYQKWLK